MSGYTTITKSNFISISTRNFISIATSNSLRPFKCSKKNIELAAMSAHKTTEAQNAKINAAFAKVWKEKEFWRWVAAKAINSQGEGKEIKQDVVLIYLNLINGNTLTYEIRLYGEMVRLGTLEEFVQKLSITTRALSPKAWIQSLFAKGWTNFMQVVLVLAALDAKAALDAAEMSQRKCVELSRPGYRDSDVSWLVPLHGKASVVLGANSMTTMYPMFSDMPRYHGTVMKVLLSILEPGKEAVLEALNAEIDAHSREADISRQSAYLSVLASESYNRGLDELKTTLIILHYLALDYVEWVPDWIVSEALREEIREKMREE